MNTKKILINLLVIVVTLNSFAQDGKTIAKKSSNAIEFESMEMVSTLNIHDGKGNTRTRQVAIATRKFGDVTKTLMRFLSPADVQGTSILVYDNETKSDDMWLYLPSMRKVRRIVSTEKGKSFMGSEFSNADMSRPNIDDFTYKVLGTEIVNGKECWKLEATCVSSSIEAENGYNKRISYIEKETNLMQKSELYDKNGKLLKVMTLTDYRKQSNGRYFAYSMDMENAVNKRRSEIRVNQFQLGSNLDENSFAVSSLEK